MLEVKNISKTYITGDLKQTALNNVSLSFRDNEFVSILGPSGSGKTTLLNIIGGLDQYDTGDLIINGISTKQYKSKDWDSYRNHTVGFVFQSYNLIPHQTILSNVELSLTISGISKKDRKDRALKALEEVGLKDQAHKKPNQMSGGQMQRVAVARALVNNPNILLADEPTGALDSETSLQVMDLLKKIAKDRLVVMVTHNPELAEEYSNRIVKLKDGEVIDDSNPVKGKTQGVKEKYKNLGNVSMSLITAFGLSLNNLLTKKGRTILTAFAGSIGIIGIALILALSEGFQRYIDNVQEEMLTSYPLTIERETTDTTGILLSAVSTEANTNEKGVDVSETKNIEKMFASVGKNDMKYFKSYIEERSSKVKEMTSYIQYKYIVSPNIFTKDINQKITRVNPSDIMSSLSGGMSSQTTSSSSMNIFSEISGSKEMIEEQYTVIKGKLPSKYDEVVIFLPDENHISDLLLYTLGLKDSEKFNEMIKKISSGEKIEDDGEKLTFTYDDLLKLELKLIINADLYRYNEQYNIYEDMIEDSSYVENLYNNAIPLKVVGIVKPKDSNGMSALMSGVGYTKELTDYIVKESSKREVVSKQKNNKDINVFNGKRFDDKSNDSGINFDELIKIDTDMLSSAFDIHIDEAAIQDMTTDYMTEISNAITADTSDAKSKFINTLGDTSKSMLKNYVSENEIMSGVANITQDDVSSIIDNYYDGEEANNLLYALEAEYTIPADVYKTVYKEFMNAFLTSYVVLASGGGDTAPIASDAVDDLINAALSEDAVNAMADEFAKNMVEATMQKTILSKVGELTGKLMGTMANAFNIDQDKIAGAFQFNLTENDIKRIFSAMSSNSAATDQFTNLLKLGYEDPDEPYSIMFYFKDFTSKEKFIDFIESYNKMQKSKDKEKVIEYSDLTGVMISSVKIIVDSVSYVLIAFVSISLIVSSIMIGIITYISVLERTKEIGILRAIGASKENISSIFNAETMIVGFFAGVLGIIISNLFLIPINAVIHFLTNNNDITAFIPIKASIILIVLSTILTLIGGLIPSSKAAKQDPVLALRSE